MATNIDIKLQKHRFAYNALKLHIPTHKERIAEIEAEMNESWRDEDHVKECQAAIAAEQNIIEKEEAELKRLNEIVEQLEKDKAFEDLGITFAKS